MMERIKSRPWLVALLASALTATLTIGGFAFAQTGDAFTGCLKSNGELAKVAIGASPTQVCSPSETQVSWNSEGPSGADGATWYSGANLPDNSLGEDGDLYLLLGDDGAAEAGDVFVKQAGTWTTDATLRGPEGPQGPEGPHGPQGEPGLAPGSFFVQGLGANLPADGSFQTVATLPIEAGNYVVIAKASSILSAGVGVSAFSLVHCRTNFVADAGGSTISISEEQASNANNNIQPTAINVTVSPTGVLSPDSSGTVELQCRGLSEVNVAANSPQLIAIGTGAVTG